MMRYAREDTHYLIYIYDCLRRDIIKKAIEENASPTNYLKSVFEKSKDISLKVYVKNQGLNKRNFMLLSRNRAILSNRKYKALEQLIEWRDSISRQEDESHHYILPNNLMFKIVDMFPLSVSEVKALKNLGNIVLCNMDSLIDVFRKVNKEEEMKEN